MIVNRTLLLASAMLLPLLAAGAANAATHHRRPVHIIHKMAVHKVGRSHVTRRHHGGLSAVKTHHAIRAAKHTQS